MNAHEGPSRWFWVTLPIGAVFMGVGLHGLIGHRNTPLGEMARWFFGAGIAHDALLAPIFVLAGVATTRLPVVARIPVRLALATSALLTVFAWPLVQGWGRRTTNPSALPLDYGRNLAFSLAAIWIVAIVTVAVRAAKR